MRLLGLDPGLRVTGWGVIDVAGNHLRHAAHGTVRSSSEKPLAVRLMELHDGLREIIAQYRPDAAAVEETFVNRNASSTLKLGQARGVVLLAPALAGVPVCEYATNLIKKSVVGTGHASKAQIAEMVRRLLPGAVPANSDAADALAAAICHAHHFATRRRWSAAGTEHVL
jgi:crossover junction endodeoxyribonuclease RuvC